MLTSVSGLRNQRRAQCGSATQCDGLPSLEGTYSGALQTAAESGRSISGGVGPLFQARHVAKPINTSSHSERKDTPGGQETSEQLKRAGVIIQFLIRGLEISERRKHQAWALARQTASPILPSLDTTVGKPEKLDT